MGAIRLTPYGGSIGNGLALFGSFGAAFFHAIQLAAPSAAAGVRIGSTALYPLAHLRPAAGLALRFIEATIRACSSDTAAAGAFLRPR